MQKSAPPHLRRANLSTIPVFFLFLGLFITHLWGCIDQPDTAREDEYAADFL